MCVRSVLGAGWERVACGQVRVLGPAQDLRDGWLGMSPGIAMRPVHALLPRGPCRALNPPPPLPTALCVPSLRPHHTPTPHHLHTGTHTHHTPHTTHHKHQLPPTPWAACHHTAPQSLFKNSRCAESINVLPSPALHLAISRGQLIDRISIQPPPRPTVQVTGGL